MARTVLLEIPVSGKLSRFQLPTGVERRLSYLLDCQDQGISLSPTERREAEGLVEMAEMLSLLKLRISRRSKLAA